MIRLEGIVVELGGVRILDGVGLEAGEAETLALLGPSGSGKSTLLRVAAGLQPPAAGRVLLDGADITRVPAHRRGVGLVFQDAVLFPHRTVGDNVGFGLRVRGDAVADRRRRVSELLELVGLAGAEQRDVGTLSGGEAQRVALARALAPSPRVLLLDEPLASLDGPLRDRLRDDLHDLFAALRLTVVHVTHDVAEAFALGRRVAVLRDGRIAQTATPDELWSRPADTWVARFLGMRNLIEDDAGLRVVRPEAVHVVPGDDAVVLAVDRRGPLTVLTVRLDGAEELEAATTTLTAPRPGDRVSVEIDPDGVVDVAADPYAEREAAHGRADDADDLPLHPR
ncbi:MAG: ABC transporter ATP-binding protein [Thermoleophilia bacterium]|nr:ABC transporter ATP-binding protein [Thermoleophilia bacterium]